jgi:hypothetical protein
MPQGMALNIVTNFMRIVTSKQGHSHKKMIFSSKKQQNQHPNKKMALAVALFFMWWLKF